MNMARRHLKDSRDPEFGGLPKQFFTLAPGPMEQVLKETLAVCRPGGGFILMEASGVPDTVSVDTWRCSGRCWAAAE